MGGLEAIFLGGLGNVLAGHGPIFCPFGLNKAQQAGSQNHSNVTPADVSELSQNRRKGVKVEEC